jgi:ABC-2 type transport system permease protein
MVWQSLRDYRRALIWWTLGIGVFLSVYMSTYVSIKQDPQTFSDMALAKLPGALKDLMGGALQDFTSGAGYLQGSVYQLFVPFLFAVCAMTLANRAIAGPEESGTLELLVTLPIARGPLVLRRFAALVLGLLIVAVATFALTWLLAETTGMGIPFGNILAAHLGVLLLGLFFGTVTLAVGAATGRKAVATAVMGVWAVAGYAVITILKDVAAVSWLKWVSPFHYYAEGRPLYDGLPVGDYLVLAGATAVLVLTAVLAFDRRDVGV